MRNPGLVVLAVVVAAIAMAIGGFVLFHGKPVSAGPSPVRTSGTEPAGAKATVRLLLSPRGRSALTPELNATLPRGQLFPAGTIFTPNPGGWRQAGAYANVTGILRKPKKRAAQVEIGLVDREGHWLVTFEEQV